METISEQKTTLHFGGQFEKKNGGQYHRFFHMSENNYTIDMSDFPYPPSGGISGGPAFSTSGCRHIAFEEYYCNLPYVYVAGNLRTIEYESPTNQDLPSYSTLKYISTSFNNTLITIKPFSITRVYMKKTDAFVIKSNKTEVCENEPVCFTAFDCDAQIYWSIPNGATLIADNVNQNNITVQFNTAGTYSISASSYIWDCSGSYQTIYSNTITVTVEAPTMTVTSSADYYRFDGTSGTPVTLTAGVSGGSSPSIWWAPTEGLYDGTSTSANSAITGSTIYARPLDPRWAPPGYANIPLKDKVKYYGRGIVTVNSSIQCVAETSATIFSKDNGADNSDFKIRFVNASSILGSSGTQDVIFLCRGAALDAFGLHVYNTANGGSYLNSSTPVDWYVNGNTTPITTNVLTETDLANAGYGGKSLWLLAHFYYLDNNGHNNEKLVSCELVVNPDAGIDFTKKEVCTNEKLQIKSASSLGNEDNLEFLWEPSANFTHDDWADTRFFETDAVAHPTVNCSFTATDASGTSPCFNQSATNTFIVSVYDTSALTFTNSTGTLLQAGYPMYYEAGPGGTVTLTASGAGYYSWFVDEGSASALTGATVTLSQGPSNSDGHYFLNSISYSGTGNCGCCSRQKIIVHPYGFRLENELEAEKMESKLLVYPNPSDGWFILGGLGAADETGTVTVSNLSGRVVLREEIQLHKGEGWKQKIILPAPGMYIVNLHTAEKDFHKTVISINE